MDDAERLSRAEQAARLASARFDALLDAAVDGIIVIDSAGSIEEFNRAACRIFGYTRDEVIGRNIHILMPEPYRAEHAQYMNNYLETGEAKIIGIGREVSGMRKDGSVFPIDLAVGEVRNEGAPKFVGLIRDITQRKADEDEIRQQRDRLSHVSRLSTMGEMATGIAHEVNQPLTAISTYANACGRMLDASDPDLEELRTLLDKVSAQSLRAGAVIQRLRDFVRKREGRRVPTSLRTLIKETATLAEVDAREHRVRLEFRLGEEDCRVLADGVQIQQVLLNLIRNAIEALDGASDDRRSIEISLEKQGDIARVAVTDLGEGVDPDIRPDLFTPFLTTKDTGMGLGLSISSSIIRAHKGTLGHEDNVAGGSVFYFELPEA